MLERRCSFGGCLLGPRRGWLGPTGHCPGGSPGSPHRDPAASGSFKSSALVTVSPMVEGSTAGGVRPYAAGSRREPRRRGRSCRPARPNIRLMNASTASSRAADRGSRWRQEQPMRTAPCTRWRRPFLRADPGVSGGSRNSIRSNGRRSGARGSAPGKATPPDSAYGLSVDPPTIPSEYALSKMANVAM